MPGLPVSSVLLVALHGLLICLTAGAEIDGGAVKEGTSAHFEVTPPAVPASGEKRREHFRALAAKDRLRHASRRQLAASSKIPEVLSDSSMFMELPMRSALNIAHVGMYLVSVRFGTPALPFNLALDTANDLTWISCRLRRRKGKHYGRSSPAAAKTMSVGEDGTPVKIEKKNWYRPALSSTWRRIRCSQAECGVLPYTTCPDASNNVSCSYYQRYVLLCTYRVVDRCDLNMYGDDV
jgi:hypothetical protein